MIGFNIFILLCLFLTCSNGWLGICDTFYIQWFVKFYFYNLYLDLLEFEINYCISLIWSAIWRLSGGYKAFLFQRAALSNCPLYVG
jgi:hypothetical protein